jgi:hypothetical protein
MSKLLSAILALAAWFTLPLAAQTVKTDQVKDYNFAQLKRFAWKANHLVTMRHPEDNILLDRKIKRAINEQLAKKGLIEDEQSPDFFLSYQGGPGDEGLQVGSAPPPGLDAIQSQSLNPSGTGTTWSAGAGSNAGFAPSVWYSVQGHFVFSALDSKSKVVVWQAQATKKWHDPQKARKNEDEEIRKLVQKSFKDFPPRNKH